MSDRGMKKWLSYKSLTEQGDFLAKMKYEKGKRVKPSVSSDKAEMIDAFLREYQGQNVEVSFFYDGYVRKVEGSITKIDPVYKYLEIDKDKRIYLKNLLDIREII